MSKSQKTDVEIPESIPLNSVPGSCDQQNDDTSNQVISSTGRAAKCWCSDVNHRRLAIWSIICGISCIGIKALIHSIEAEKEPDPENATESLQKAKKLGIISIVTWVSILISIPILMALISYLITLQD
ncbi:transmembrane protein 265-like [Xenentodon cancila]